MAGRLKTMPALPDADLRGRLWQSPFLCAGQLSVWTAGAGLWRRRELAGGAGAGRMRAYSSVG